MGELNRAAVLEFGSGVRTPLLLVEESAEVRERFISAMQILRLYRGAAERLESAKQRSERGLHVADSPSSPSAGSGGAANQESRTNSSSGPRLSPPSRMGTVADDTAPDDGCRQIVPPPSE